MVKQRRKERAALPSVADLRACCERRGIRCEVSTVPRNDYSNLEERMARAISWLARAEALNGPAQADDRLIFCWIAFNSLYAGMLGEQRHERDFANDRQQWRDLVSLAVQGVRRQRFADALAVLEQPARALVNNIYTSAGYWRQLEPWGDGQWLARHEQDRHDVSRYYDERQSGARPGGAGAEPQDGRREAALIHCVLDRVYVLRNQMIHGGAGYGDGYNRDQIQLSARLMSPLLCVLVQALLESGDAEPKVTLDPVRTPPQGHRPDVPTTLPTPLRD